MDRLTWIGTSISQLLWPLQDAEPHYSKNTERSATYFAVPQGQMTFDAEGIEQPGARFHSRRPQVPSSSSGITIGRGFDLGMQSPATIRTFLQQAGFDLPYIEAAVGAAGLRGREAQEYLEITNLGEITPRQQWQLFNLTYQEMLLDVQRICRKADTVTRYGSVAWDSLSPEVKDILVDLRYRGDYTPETRALVQGFIVRNDSIGLAQVLANRDFWVIRQGVPDERFKLRQRYLDAARSSFFLPLTDLQTSSHSSQIEPLRSGRYIGHY